MPERPCLGKTLERRGVRDVMVFPSAVIDHVVRDLHAEGSTRLRFCSSEWAAAWAALGYADLARRRVAVLVGAGFSLAAWAQVFDLARERHLAVDLLCLGPDPFETRPEPWWPPMVALDDLDRRTPSAHDGPLIVVDRPSTGRTPVHCEILPGRHAPSAVVTDRWIRDSAPAGRLVIALPPPLHPSRQHLVDLAVGTGLPVVTGGGLDPFPSTHPSQWLGRIGFTPSPAAVGALAPTGASTLVVAPGVGAPSWIGARVVAAEDGVDMRPGAECCHRDGGCPTASPVGTMRGPAVDVPVDSRVPELPEASSPGLAAIRELAARFPSAVFVADAGSAHRYVAGVVANVGRDTLTTDGMTYMGWSLPTTAGAACVDPERTFVTVIGDGSMMFVGAQLADLVHARVRAVVLVLVNRTLGARYVDSTDLDELSRLPMIDWVALAEAAGIEAAWWRPGDDDVLARAEVALAESRPFVLAVETPPSHPDLASFPIVVDGIDELLERRDGR